MRQAGFDSEPSPDLADGGIGFAGLPIDEQILLGIELVQDMHQGARFIVG